MLRPFVLRAGHRTSHRRGSTLCCGASSTLVRLRHDAPLQRLSGRALMARIAAIPWPRRQSRPGTCSDAPEHRCNGGHAQAAMAVTRRPRTAPPTCVMTQRDRFDGIATAATGDRRGLADAVHDCRVLIAAPLLAGVGSACPACRAAEPTHGIAMHGAPELPPGFPHLPYVNPDAPKGGRLVLGALGSFDSLNPLIVSGVAASGMREFVFESLMARALDEPFTLYGLIAESIEVPEDRSVDHLPPQPQGALLRRRPDHRRRRALQPCPAEGQGPAQPAHLLRQGGEGRADRRVAACASRSSSAATARSR